MLRTKLFLAATILLGLVAEDLEAQELLIDLDPAHELRLVTYNWGALQQYVYLAARYRVVATDGGLLLQDSPITITPFPDVEPFVVTPFRACRHENSIGWGGTFQLDPTLEKEIAAVMARDPVLRAMGITPSYGAYIHLSRWDVGDSGIASLAIGSRPRSSAHCEDIGQDVAGSDQGVREDEEPLSEGFLGVARDHGFREIRDGEFASVSIGAFQVPGSKRYMLEPLRYTPKYSLVIEYDEEKYLAMTLMVGSGIDHMPAEEQARIREIQAQISALSSVNEVKPILVDVE